MSRIVNSPRTQNAIMSDSHLEGAQVTASSPVKGAGAGLGQVVAIIGGGFTGATAAWNLARKRSDIDILVFEPRAILGAGVAYDTNEPVHRINVPASRMTIDTESPDDFAEDDYRRSSPRFTGDNFAKNLRLVEKVAELANARGVKPSQLALAWVLAQGDDRYWKSQRDMATKLYASKVSPEYQAEMGGIVDGVNAASAGRPDFKKVDYTDVLALNSVVDLMFSDAPGAFTQEAADMGALLVSFASVALSAASQREEATGLREAMMSNREIGKAVGMLMATHDLTDEEAFQRLRAASNRLNTRLADIAAQVVADHQATLEGDS